MATVALPFMLTTIGSALPVVGGFVTDILAFTGASSIIEDVAGLIFKPNPEVNMPLKKYDTGENIADVGEGIAELIAKIPK